MYEAGGKWKSMTEFLLELIIIVAGLLALIAVIITFITIKESREKDNPSEFEDSRNIINPARSQISKSDTAIEFEFTNQLPIEQAMRD